MCWEGGRYYGKAVTMRKVLSNDAMLFSDELYRRGAKEELPFLVTPDDSTR